MTWGSRPTWMDKEAWCELLSYWDTQKFKEKSSQNKSIGLRLV